MSNYQQGDFVPPTQSTNFGYQQTPSTLGFQPGTQAYPGYTQSYQQTFPQTGAQVLPTGLPTTQLPTSQRFPFVEQSYIENILRLNKDKVANVYMNFENSEWGSKVFKGAVEAAGTDHIILRDIATNVRYLLPTIYLSYITFDEEIFYYYPIPGQPPITNIPPTNTTMPQQSTNTPYTQFRKKDTTGNSNNPK